MKRGLLALLTFTHFAIANVFVSRQQKVVPVQVALNVPHYQAMSQANFEVVRDLVLQSSDYAIKNAYLANVKQHVRVIDLALHDSAEGIFKLLDLEVSLDVNESILGCSLDEAYNQEISELEAVLSQPCQEFFESLQKIFLDKQGRFKLALSPKEREQFAYAVARYLKQVLTHEEYITKIKAYARDGIHGFEKIYRFETGQARPGEKMLFHALSPVRALGNTFAKNKNKNLFEGNPFNHDVKRVIGLCKQAQFNEAKEVLSYYEKALKDIGDNSSLKKLKFEYEQNCETLKNVISQYAEVDGQCFTALTYSYPKGVEDVIKENFLCDQAKRWLQVLDVDIQRLESFQGNTEQVFAHKEIIRLINEVSVLLGDTHNLQEEGFLLGLIDNALVAYELNQANSFGSFSEIVEDVIKSSRLNHGDCDGRYHFMRNKNLGDPELNRATQQTADLALLAFDSYMGSMTRTAEEQYARCVRDFNVFRTYKSNFTQISQERFDQLALEIFSPAVNYHGDKVLGSVLAKQVEFQRLIEREELCTFSPELYAEQYKLMNDVKDDYLYQAHDALEAGDVKTYKRYMARVDAIIESSQKRAELRQQRFSFSDKAQELLRKSGYDPMKFSEIKGDLPQIQLQQELVDIIEETALVIEDYGLQDQQLFKATVIDFVDLAHDHNQAGSLYTANLLTDFCWGTLDCALAVGEGTVEGALATVNYMYDHPLETAGVVVAGKYVAAFKLSQLMYNLGDLGYSYYADPEQAAVKWNQYMEPLQKISESIIDSQGNLNIPETLKVGSQVATQVYLGSKLYNCLDHFYDGAQRTALNFARKYQNPKAEQILATPDGRLMQTGRDALNRNFFKQDALKKGKGSRKSVPGDPKKVIFDFSDQLKSGKVSEFKILQKMIDHSFSTRHNRDGLLKVAGSKENFIKKAAEKIIEMENKGLVRERDNQIWTNINGEDVTVRCYVIKGKVLSVDVFLGHAKRIIGHCVEL